MKNFEYFFNEIKYIFFADISDYFKVIISGYCNPTIDVKAELRQEVREIIRTLIAAFIIGGGLIYVINNLIFFSLTINISNLISILRLFLSILLGNLIFGLIFSITVSILFYLSYKLTFKSVIISVGLSCFYFAVKLYALMAFACFVVVDLMYVNYLYYGSVIINLYSSLVLNVLILFLLFFSVWWFYINPIYKLVNTCKYKLRIPLFYLYSHYKKIVNIVVTLFARVTFIGVFSCAVMLVVAPKIVIQLLIPWQEINKQELYTEISKSPFYHLKKSLHLSHFKNTIAIL